MKILDVGRGRGGFAVFALSPDGVTLAAGHYSRVVLWDVRTGRQLAKATPGIMGVPDGLTFTADGRFLAAGSAQACFLWEVRRRGDFAKLLPYGRAGPRRSGWWASVFAPHRSRAQCFEMPNGVFQTWAGMRFLPGGQTLVLSALRLGPEQPVPVGPDYSGLLYIDTTTGWATFRHLSGPFNPMALPRSGGFIATCSADRTQVDVWPPTGPSHTLEDLPEECDPEEPPRTLSCTEPALAIAASDDGSTLTCMGSRKLRVWSMPEGKKLTDLQSDAGDWDAIALSPDGRMLLASHGREIDAFDLPSGEPRNRFDFGIGKVTALAFAPDGLTALAGGPDGKLAVWDLD